MFLLKRGFSMNRFITILVFNCLFWPASNYSFDCLRFNFHRDMPKIKSILKKEWSKLFLSPSYDENLIHKMFFKKHPGDTSVTHTTTTIDVLYQDDHLVGFVTYYVKASKVGHLELLCVGSAHRKKGYGTFLIEHVIDEVKKQGCTTLQLYVYTSNPNAITYYKHLGFGIKVNFGSYILMYKDI